MDVIEELKILYRGGGSVWGGSGWGGQGGCE